LNSVSFGSGIMISMMPSSSSDGGLITFRLLNFGCLMVRFS
jgi:hypothetical protein